MILGSTQVGLTRLQTEPKYFKRLMTFYDFLDKFMPEPNVSQVATEFKKAVGDFLAKK